MTITTAPETFAPLHDIIEPKWWTGTPAISPELFTIDGNDFRIPGEPLVPSTELAECMQKTFDSIGLVHVINTGLSDMQAMRLIATQVPKKNVNMKAALTRARPCSPMFMKLARL